MDLPSGRASSPSQSDRFLRRREQIGRWLLAATVVLSALGLGGLHTPVLIAVAIMAALTLGLLWWDADPFSPRPAATVLVVTGVLLIGWTILQCIPLPHNALAAISAETADVWAHCLSPLREAG